MKKIFSLFFLLTVFGLSSGYCQNSLSARKIDQLLNFYAKAMAEECPIALNDKGNITDLRYKNKEFYMDIILYENPTFFKSVSDNPALYKKTYAAAWYYLLQEVCNADFRYKGLTLTEEQLYPHITGTNILIIEENTHKSIELKIPTADIIKAKDYKFGEFLEDEINREDFIQNITEEQYKESVREESKSTCPMAMGNITMDSMQYDNKTLTYYYSLSSKNLLTSDIDDLKEKLARQIKSRGLDIPLYKNILKFNAGIAYNYYIYDLDSNYNIRFEPEELAALLSITDEESSANSIEALKDLCYNQNLACPTKIDDLTILDSATLSNNRLIFHYTVTEHAQYTISTMQENKDLIKASFITSLENPDNPIGSYFIKSCAKAQYGITHIYSTQDYMKTATIDISAEEIKDISKSIPAINND